MRERLLRVGNGAGFWGDNLDAPYLLARDGQLDVLTLEYLAELTLAILSHVRSRDPDAGYVTDFLDFLTRIAPLVQAQPNLTVVTNAGGLNARSCARRSGAILSQAGLGQEAIAVVEGDDALGSIREWSAAGVDLSHMETGQPIAEVIDRLVCANVYLGAKPIAAGLKAGARIVLTGRVADASLTLGPACASWDWPWDDWPKLAGATIAGHLIECGAQATGGLWHEWERLGDLAQIGYPVAELRRDGSFAISKPAGTGGLVSVGTVAEQLVYEIDDPTCYRTPDVDVDLTSVSLVEDGPDRVVVSGARGRAPSDRLKMAAVYRDGWTASGMLAVAGRGAEPKARRVGEVLLERVARAGFALEESLVECLGAGAVVPGLLRPVGAVAEVVLRVSARDHNRAAIERFCREFAPMVTSGPAGIAGYATGRPSARPAYAYWPALVPRSLIQETVSVRTASEWAEESACV
jgi:hypothetical protein